MDDAQAQIEMKRRKTKQQNGEQSKDMGNALINWLEQLSLGKYTRIFMRQEVDFDTLVELSSEDLRDMGITALGPRKKLVAAINAMKNSSSGMYSTSELYQG